MLMKISRFKIDLTEANGYLNRIACALERIADQHTSSSRVMHSRYEDTSESKEYKASVYYPEDEKKDDDEKES